jgi:hypothetical protein
VAAPAITQLLEDVRPLARQLAAELVRQELAELQSSLNGNSLIAAEVHVEAPQLPSKATNGPGGTSGHPPASTDRKTCTLCGETKPAEAFNPGRRQCRKCRNARYPRSSRARTTADKELPRTEGTA